MILANVQVVGEAGKKNIHIKNGSIAAIATELAVSSSQENIIEFENAIAFPGLINSHDHLDFNLFPQLGNRIYNNYVEWGDDIHEKDKATINSILTIPKKLRIQWGVYKNLLNGVTTVVNHGEKLDIPNNIITVFQNSYSLHSVKLERGWKYQLNSPFAKKYPFSIHVGEGTDIDSHDEIDEVIKWNVLKRKIVGIHGVAMDERQAISFHALVWCPDSNFFLLGTTAAVNKLKTATNILFGTDSTVSANWNIWQQLRTARATKLLTDTELINTISTTPAAIWKLNNTGTIKESNYADIVIAKEKTNTDTTDAFFAVNPEDILLVLHKGYIAFFDESLLPQLKNISVGNYSKIFINKTPKYIIGDLPSLIKEIKKYNRNSFFPIEIE
jgi:cytosine/adenosine deaminase-related metal-dependent hydrolase